MRRHDGIRALILLGLYLALCSCASMSTVSPIDAPMSVTQGPQQIEAAGVGPWGGDAPPCTNPTGPTAEEKEAERTARMIVGIGMYFAFAIGMIKVLTFGH